MAAILRVSFLLSLVGLGMGSTVSRPNGCVCSDFTWFRDFTFAGDCRAADADGLRFCYVHQPHNCFDADPSSRFRGMEVSKLACGCSRSPSGFCEKRPRLIDVVRIAQSNLVDPDAGEGIVKNFYIDPVTNETVPILQKEDY